MNHYSFSLLILFMWSYTVFNFTVKSPRITMSTITLPQLYDNTMSHSKDKQKIIQCEANNSLRILVDITLDKFTDLEFCFIHGNIKQTAVFSGY